MSPPLLNPASPSLLCAADPTISKHFQATLIKSDGYTDPYGPLMKLLARSSVFVLDKASCILAKLLTIPSVGDGHSAQVLSRHLQTFSEWVMYLLKSVEPKDAADSPKTQFAVRLAPSCCRIYNSPTC